MRQILYFWISSTNLPMRWLSSDVPCNLRNNCTPCYSRNNYAACYYSENNYAPWYSRNNHALCYYFRTFRGNSTLSKFTTVTGRKSQNCYDGPGIITPPVIPGIITLYVIISGHSEEVLHRTSARQSQRENHGTVMAGQKSAQTYTKYTTQSELSYQKTRS